MNVPGAGLEPARPQWPQDFKSCVSTNSTTRANSAFLFLKRPKKIPIIPIKPELHREQIERETGLEPATPTLARSCSTN